MATIGSIAVNISASTAGFAKGMKQAQGMLGSFVGKISGVHAAVAGLATGALAAVVTSAVEAASKIQDLSDKLHISSEAISALHYAADQLGSSAEAVDTALSKLSVTLGKAAGGAESAIAAFSKIGLNFQDLLSKPIEQQFLAVVDALNKIPDASVRAAAAQEIFGKSSKELMAIVNAGTDAIIKQGQAAADAGAIMSSDTVAALDNVGDSISSLGKTWENLKLQAVGAFAPILDWLAYFAGAVLKVWRSIVEGVKIALSAMLAAVLEAANLGVQAINTVLPKKWEIDQGGALQAMANSQIPYMNERAASIGRIWNGGEMNPLAKPGDTKKLEQNTSDTNKRLDTLIQLQQRQGPQLAVAGVR